MSDKAPDDQSHYERVETMEWLKSQIGQRAEAPARAPEPDGVKDPAAWMAWVRAEREAARNADVPTRLRAIRARLAAASPGPWGTCHVRSDGSLCPCGLIWGSGEGMIATACGGEEGDAPGRPEDAQFIAHSREDTEWLLGLATGPVSSAPISEPGGTILIGSTRYFPQEQFLAGMAKHAWRAARLAVAIAAEKNRADKAEAALAAKHTQLAEALARLFDVETKRVHEGMFASLRSKRDE